MQDRPGIPGAYAPLGGRMSWRTADGAVLTLPAGARPGFGGESTAHRAVRPWRFRERRRMGALGRMLAGARCVGRVRSRATGRRFLLFRGSLGRARWEVLARRADGGRAEIVAIRPAGTFRVRPARPAWEREDEAGTPRGGNGRAAARPSAPRKIEVPKHPTFHA